VFCAIAGRANAPATAAAINCFFIKCSPKTFNESKKSNFSKPQAKQVRLDVRAQVCIDTLKAFH
jgi:hypothetical protein